MERRGVDYERLDDRRVYFDVDHPSRGSSMTPSLERAPELHGRPVRLAGPERHVIRR
jgi:hypothetical protein